MSADVTRRSALLGGGGVFAGVSVAWASEDGREQGGGGLIAGIARSSVPADLMLLETQGYYRVGDGGQALYCAQDRKPEHDACFQSRDGRWWEPVGQTFSALALGVRFDGKSDDTAAWLRVLSFARVRAGLTVYTPAGTSLCAPNQLFLSGPSIKPIVRLRLVSEGARVNARNLSDSVIDFSRIGGSGRGYPRDPLAWEGYDYGFRALAHRPRNPEQSGVDGLELGLTIVPPDCGVGLMISQGRNLRFSGFKVITTQSPGRRPQYGMVLDKCISVNICDESTFGGAGFHRFGIFLYSNSGLDSGINLYNDSIYISNCQFSGSCFACIADWGSQSEGVRGVERVLQSGASYYFYIGSQIPNLTFGSNWFELIYQPLCSPAPTAEGAMPIPGPALPGVDGGVRYEEVVQRGVSGGHALIQNLFLASARGGLNLSGFAGAVDVRGTVLAHTRDMMDFVRNDSGAGGITVEPPQILNPEIQTSSFSLVRSEHGAIGLRGSGAGLGRGGEAPEWFEDAIIGGRAAALDAYSYPINARRIRVLPLLSTDLGNYPVLEMPLLFSGLMAVDIQFASGVPGAPYVRKVVELVWGVDEAGELALREAKVTRAQWLGGSGAREPASWGVATAFIRNRSGRPATIFLGVAVPAPASLPFGVARARIAYSLDGAVNVVPRFSGHSQPNAALNPSRVTDRKTASARISANAGGQNFVVT